MIKTTEQIEKMRLAGKLASEVLEMVTPLVKPGISTGELDKICHDFIVNEQDAIPAILSLHQIEYARRFADRIIGLSRGKVVFDGPPTELLDKIIDDIYAFDQR